MTKEQLIELVKKRLGEDAGFGDRTIAKNLALAWNTVMLQAFAQNPHNLDRYTRPYKETIQVDSDSEIKYAELPEGTMQSPDIGNGIRNISTKQDTELQFVPMRFYEVQTISNIDAGYISTKAGFYVRNNRIEFHNLKDSITEVLVDAVIGFDFWEDEDNVDLPMGTASAIIGLTVEFMQGTPFIPIRQRRMNLEEDNATAD